MNKHIELIKIISEITGINENLILGKDRTRKIVNARQLLCYYLRIRYKYKLQTIGNLFNMHHSSIMHSICFIKTMIEINDQLILDYIKQIDLYILNSNINIPDKIIIQVDPLLNSNEIIAKLKKEYNTCDIEISL